ncbi:MAG: hypothetical protein KatS3mg104_1862 [Phycisphaerae bacterium]|nr:MAG: hypothetical protein KatS3mg104_1862 [Phycisphaerae bacterium]
MSLLPVYKWSFHLLHNFSRVAWLMFHVGVEEGGRPLANRRSMVPARVVWSKRVTEDRECVRVGLEFLSFTTARAA